MDGIDPDQASSANKAVKQEPLLATDAEGSTAEVKPTVNRRTKTGCLTCRKRRIKCGEERPACTNCIKSNKHCEGYKPPVVFRRAYTEGSNARKQPRLLPYDSSAEQQQQHQSLASGAYPRIASKADNSSALHDASRDEVFTDTHRPGLNDRVRSIVDEGRSLVAETKHFLPNSFGSLPSRPHERHACADGASSSQLQPYSEEVTISYSARYSFNDGKTAQRTLEHAATEHVEHVVTQTWSWARPEPSHRSFTQGLAMQAVRQKAVSQKFAIPMVPTMSDEDKDFDEQAELESIYSYRPEQVANPLSNPSTATLLKYYRDAVGPLSSPWARNPLMTAAELDRCGGPLLTRSFFLYSVPMLALHDQCLLHAALTLTSYHIHRRYGTSATPALKHYSWCLKRLYNSVRSADRRLNPGVLIATVFLANYEGAMTTDLAKWNTHLRGASQLVKEIDFGDLTKHVYALKHIYAEFKAQRELSAWSQPSLAQEQAIADLTSALPDMDDDHIMQAIAGTSRPDLYRQDNAFERPTKSPNDLHLYPVLQDSFWYLMNMYMVYTVVQAGEPPIPYQRLLEVPPRTLFHEDVVGASDYLHILIHRLCDFNFRDRPRKVKASQAIFGPVPPVQFYGLSPYNEQGRMHRAFQPRNIDPTLPAGPTPEPLATDLGSATMTATAEWNEIKASFDFFEERLETHYPPLPENENTPMTVFGRAIMHPTYAQGALWAVFYMGRILLERMHPSMPAQHIIAIGMAARQTADYANRIGRIIAGMSVEALKLPYTSAQAGGFVETAFTLFVAGVQFEDNEQRYFTVRRFRETEQLTGFLTCRLESHGCEVVWQRAHAAGRGPPYTPVGTEIAPQT